MNIQNIKLPVEVAAENARLSALFTEPLVQYGETVSDRIREFHFPGLDRHVFETCYHNKRTKDVMAPHPSPFKPEFNLRIETIMNKTGLNASEADTLVHDLETLELPETENKRIIARVRAYKPYAREIHELAHPLVEATAIPGTDAMNFRRNDIPEHLLECYFGITTSDEYERRSDMLDANFMNTIRNIDNQTTLSNDHHKLGEHVDFDDWLNKQTPKYRKLYNAIRVNRSLRGLSKLRGYFRSRTMPRDQWQALFNLLNAQDHAAFEHSANGHFRELKAMIEDPTRTHIGAIGRAMYNECQRLGQKAQADPYWNYIWNVYRKRKAELAKDFDPSSR